MRSLALLSMASGVIQVPLTLALKTLTISFHGLVLMFEPNGENFNANLCDDLNITITIGRLLWFLSP